jgi:hypothetical protein
MAHHESCKGCKREFLKSLKKQFGEVIDEWSSGWPCRIEDVLCLSNMNKTTAQSIKNIYAALQKHRGHEDFIRVKNLSQCDYYVKSLNCLVEIDESQHFTAPRGISLSLYPKRFKSGFNRDVWIKRCRQLDRHDNSPKDRDENRAWYETLRDILPPLLGMEPTIRIFAKDLVRCEEDYKKIIGLLKKSIFIN